MINFVYRQLVDDVQFVSPEYLVVLVCFKNRSTGCRNAPLFLLFLLILFILCSNNLLLFRYFFMSSNLFLLLTTIPPLLPTIVHMYPTIFFR